MGIEAKKRLSPEFSRRQSCCGTPGSTERPVALLAHTLLLAGAAAAVFLTGGAPQGSSGIFLVCAGAALMLCPPGVKVDGSLWLAAAALLLCASLAFLPVHSFPLPAWRKALEGMPVIRLPVTITPVPWQTAFWLALLASTALIGLFALAQPVRSTGLLSLTLAAALVCGAYAALAIDAKTTGWHYPFDGGATFGFFPNRNHTATFLVTGSILATGILGVTLRDGRWMTAGLAMGALAACVAGLFFYSASRGGIIFLLAGTLLWVAGLGRTHRSGALLVSFVSVLLAGAAFFLLSGGEAQSRLLAFFEHAHPVEAAQTFPVVDGAARAGKALSDAGGIPLDERVLIYEDTLPFIGAFPVTGSGLGTFAMVFPQYRNASLSEAPAIHPESDWLMFAAEAGLPAMLCVFTLIWLLGRRLPPLRKHPNWPLRWGCVAAAGAAALHGLVDVPAHHASLGWWIMVLAGLALQRGPVKPLPRSRLQQAIFILGGVGMFILGVQLIRAEWFGAEALPPFAAERTQAGIVQAYEHHDIEGAARIARQVTFASPLAETFYYEWGALKLPFAGTDAEVDGAFAAERLLEPGSPAIPLRQGDAWLRYDSARPVALWLDALSRRQRMDRVAGSGPSASTGFYRDLLVRAAMWPDVQRGLLAATDDHPPLALAWLESARPELVRSQLERFVTEDGFLQHLNADERRRFLLAWYIAGDRGKLTRFINGHADWQKMAWPVQVRQWVDAQEYERAVDEVASHYRISLALPALGQEGSSTDTLSEEQVDPIAAFNAYWRTGNTVAAHRVLDETTGSAARSVPAEIWRLKAAIAAQKSDWAVAWQNLRQCVRTRFGDEAF